MTQISYKDHLPQPLSKIITLGMIGDSISSHGQYPAPWGHTTLSFVAGVSAAAAGSVVCGPIYGRGGWTSSDAVNGPSPSNPVQGSSFYTWQPLTYNRCSHILVLLGTNDVATNFNINTTLKNLQTIYSYILSIGKDPIAVSVPPRGDYAYNVTSLNKGIKNLAAQMGILYVDIYSGLIDYSTNYMKTIYQLQPSTDVHPNTAAVMGVIGPAIYNALNSFGVVPLGLEYSDFQGVGEPVPNNLFQTITGTINTPGSIPNNVSISGAGTSTVWDYLHDPNTPNIVKARSNVFQVAMGASGSTNYTTLNWAAGFSLNTNAGDIMHIAFCIAHNPATSDTSSNDYCTCDIRDGNNLSQPVCPFGMPNNITDTGNRAFSGTVCMEFTAPNAITNSWIPYANMGRHSGNANGDMSLSNLTLVNLSALGFV